MRSLNKEETKPVRIGKVVSVHGLGGVLKIASDADSPAVFTDCGPLWIRRKDLDGNRRWEVIRVQAYKGRTVLLTLKDIQDRTAAEGLVGGILFADRSRFPELEEDVFYWDDLIGLTVQEEDGSQLGRIRRVMETGAHDVYEVTGGPKELLVPGLASVVIDVNLGEGVMTVRLPEGLAEL